MAPYLMDALLPRVRAQGLATLLAAHHPARLPLDWLMTQLGWEEDQEQEVGVHYGDVVFCVGCGMSSLGLCDADRLHGCRWTGR
jgi:hypothetical protein